MSNRGSGDERQNPPTKISYRGSSNKQPNRSSIPKKRPPVDEKKRLEGVQKLVEKFKMDVTACRKKAFSDFQARNTYMYMACTNKIGELEEGIEKVEKQALEKRKKQDVNENVEKKVEQDVEPRNKKDVNENVEKKVEQDGKPRKSKPNSPAN